MSALEIAWERLERAIAAGALASIEDAERITAAMPHASLDLDGGLPFRIQLFLWESPIDPHRDRHEDEAIAILGALADRMGARPGFHELDAFREARFEQHVVEALDVALFRSDALDVAIVADSPDPDVPVFVIAEIWARRRPTERDAAVDPLALADARARLDALVDAALIGRTRAECLAPLASQGWTVFREWEDALALYRGTDAMRIALDDDRCELVAATLGSLPATDEEASSLVRALAPDPAPRPDLDAIAESRFVRDGIEVRVIADAATGSLRLELERARRSSVP